MIAWNCGGAALAASLLLALPLAVPLASEQSIASSDAAPIKDAVARFIDAFNRHDEVQDCFAAGDKVAVRWVATMHHRGRGLGIEPTGAEVKVGGMGIARIAEGKILEAWDNYDKQAMFQQIAAAAKAKIARA